MKNRTVLAIALASALLAGCGGGGPPYAANTTVVSQLGEDAALAKLKKILSQASGPQITATSIDVTNEYFFYQALDLQMYGRGTVSRKVFYKEVDHAEVWESRGNTYVKLISTEGKKLDQIKWNAETDAKDFADLVMSFKSGGGGGGSKKAPEEKEAPAEGEKAAE